MLTKIIVILIVGVIGVGGYLVISSEGEVYDTDLSNSTSTATTTTSNISESKEDNFIEEDLSIKWKQIDAPNFTLFIPTDWKFNQLQGIDSYLGELVGPEAKLTFDFGLYSDSLVADDDPNYVITYENIDGYKAKIIKPKTIGLGTVGVYFDNVGGGGFQTTKLQISGQDLSKKNQEIALQIFRSIEFK